MHPRLLTRADIPGAMRLKEAAGWNQTARDWENLLALEPEGCFGIDCGGTLAATATAVCYGRELAWIGMVLTAPEFRGRGFARALMEHALGWLEARGIQWIKLDATDMGRPLYTSLGFVDEQPVERWARDAAPSEYAAHNRAATGPYRAATVRERFFDPALDASAFGAGRSSVLERVALESMIIDSGYALGRAGTKAAYFGPCVARDPAPCLVEWFLNAHEGEPVYWDLLPNNANAVRIAEKFGFHCVRSLVRMARPGAPHPLPLGNNDRYVYAIAGFEFG